MSRPKKCRCVACNPKCIYFKPRGIPLVDLDEVCLGLDELEALRLADYEGLYHEESAKRMDISRATFGRVLVRAHQKVAEVLLTGKALRIETNHNGGVDEGMFRSSKG
jgi:uncharacterized protein